MTHPARGIRRESLGPREADEPHRVLPPAPAPITKNNKRYPITKTNPGPTAKPAIDAYTLLKSWRRARMNGDRTNADKLLAELERLAERKRRTEGEHDG
jgi:hypothetical protein